MKLPRRQIKDSRYSEAATEGHIGNLSFLSKSLKNACERKNACETLLLVRFHAIGLQCYFFQVFLKDFVGRFSWQNYRTAFLKKNFSIRTFPMAASVYTNNFLMNKRSKHIYKYRQSFTSGVSRISQLEFFVALALG